MQIHSIQVWNEVADTIEERTVTLHHVGRRDDDWHNQIMYVVRDDMTQRDGVLVWQEDRTDAAGIIDAGWEYFQPPFKDPEGREAAKELLELLYESPLEDEDEQQ